MAAHSAIHEWTLVKWEGIREAVNLAIASYAVAGNAKLVKISTSRKDLV